LLFFLQSASPSLACIRLLFLWNELAEHLPLNLQKKKNYKWVFVGSAYISTWKEV
jgi:hypothetical protein